MLRFGGPVWTGDKDPEVLARKHRELGYRAAYCPDVPVGDTEAVKAARKAFEDAGVVIAEVGAWVNLMDPDDGTRRKNLEFVTNRLALADEIGALCCVDIAGSFNPDQWDGPHPLNLGKEYFDLTVENARKIIDAVNPRTAKFSLEMMPYTLPDSPDSFLDLLKAVDRPAFGIHLDPVNIINSPRRYYCNGDLLRECFSKLGQWVVSCHAKDTILRPGFTVHIDECRPGLGCLDYGTYLTELSKLPQSPPLMLEHLSTEEEYSKAKEFLFSRAQGLGLEY
jgi:sugar phosphate isomerase/epimerase